MYQWAVQTKHVKDKHESIMFKKKPHKFLLEIKYYGNIIIKGFLWLILHYIMDRFQVTEGDSLMLCKRT